MRMLAKGLLALTIVLLVHSLARAGDPFVAAQKDPRTNINMNRQWRFLLGDSPGAEVPNFDDSHWTDVGLPHSFSIPYFLSRVFYVGYGWYRKHLQMPEAAAGKRIFLEFDGVSASRAGNPVVRTKFTTFQLRGNVWVG